MATYSLTFASMGCPCEARVEGLSAPAAREALQAAKDEVHRLDLKYSNYRPGNALERLLSDAQRPGGVRVDAETAALLDLADALHRQSGGRFDLGAEPLARLWEARDTLPEDEELAAALEHVGWHRVGWRDGCLRLPAGMRLDFGALVKEYAADRAALVLKRAGATSGLLDLGGDLHVLGPHADGTGWRAGIRSPSQRERAVVTVGIRSGGLATSGDYERGTTIDGIRYGHIVDATTGWPVRGLASASVIAPSCLLAGAVSTLALLQPAEAGLRHLQQSGLDWLAVDAQGGLHGPLAPAPRSFRRNATA